MFNLTEWLHDHRLVTFLIIYVFLTYVYNKVFKVRRLPILKEIIIYLALGVGALMLLLFQIAGLPIVYCLAVAISLMLLVRVRYFFENRKQR
jgi:hypothetical protein